MRLKLIVDRIEEGEVVLVSEDQQALIWPRHKLPAELKEGQVLFFTINVDQPAEESARQSAVDVLNDILNN